MNERLKTFLIGLCEAGLVVTLLFSVATAFSEWHQYIELFSHFRMQFLVVSVLLTLVFVFLKWRNYLLLGLATIAVNAWSNPSTRRTCMQRHADESMPSKISSRNG